MTQRLPPDPENKNADRAEWAAAALRHFQCTTGTDFDDALCDLLGDLMHWSDRNNMDFGDQLARAREHYEAETALPVDDQRAKSTAKRRRYHVVYAITREETYEIEAADAVEAEQEAFSDGKFIDTEETTNVECCEIRQVGARRRPYRCAVRSCKGGKQ